MKQLTQRQKEVLDLIRDHIREEGMPPTRAEIAGFLGLRSANAAEDHLRALARKGYIEVLSGRNRNIRLLETTDYRSHSLPVVGRVAAGTPILAEENLEGHYSCTELFSPRADYLLRVEGLSMRDAGIMDGDLLAVHRTGEAHNGQIAVVRLQDEVTVKRFRREQRWVFLLPENPDYDPIEVDLSKMDLAVEGIAVGILRKL